MKSAFMMFSLMFLLILLTGCSKVNNTSNNPPISTGSQLKPAPALQMETKETYIYYEGEEEREITEKEYQDLVQDMSNDDQITWQQYNVPESTLSFIQ